MQIPALPTDNLYKFMALAGLVIAIGVPLFIGSQMVRLQTDVAATGAHIESLDTRVEYLREHADFWRKNDKAVPEIALERMLQAQDLIIERQRDANVMRKKNDVRLDYIREFAMAGLIAMAVGAFTSLAGFALWYAQVQRPSDLIIKAQANVARRELQASMQENSSADQKALKQEENEGGDRRAAKTT